MPDFDCAKCAPDFLDAAVSDSFRDVLDVLPDTVVVLDMRGAIIWVNRSWADFARRNGADQRTIVAVGLNYYDICRSGGAPEIAEHIRAVSSGAVGDYKLEYACHSPTQLRWFSLTVRPLVGHMGCAVLIHSDTTARRVAESERATRCEMLRRTLDTVETIIVSLDLQGRVTDINAFGANLLGMPESSIVGLSWFDTFLLKSTERDRVRDVFDGLVASRTGASETFENEIALSDGSTRLISWRNAVLRNEVGEVVGTLSSGIDVTAERRLIRQQAIDHQAMRMAQSIGHFGNWWWDEETQGWHCSDEARCLFRLADDEALSPWALFKRVCREDRRALLDHWRALRRGLSSGEIKYRIVAGADVRWIKDRVAVRREGCWGGMCCYGTSQDITDSTLTELALKESERFLREAQEVARIGTYVFDVVNDAWTSSDVLDTIFGIGRDFPRTTSSWLRLVLTEDQQAVQTHLADVLCGEVARFDHEYRISRGPDRRMRWVHGFGKVEWAADGSALRMVGTIMDITERKSVERALRETRESYVRLFMLNPLPMWVCTREDLRFLDVNNAAVEAYGYSRGAILVMHATDLDPGIDEVLPARDSASRRQGLVRARRQLRADGTVFDVALQAEAIDYHGCPAWLVICEDVTLKKQLDDALGRKVQLAEQLKHIAATVPGAIYAFRRHADGRYSIPFIDGRQMKVLGVSADQFSEDASGLIRYVFDEDLEGLFASIAHSAASMQEWQRQFRVVHPLQGVRWLEGHGIPQPMEGGGVLWHGYLSDVTDRVEATRRLEQSHTEIRTLAAHMEVVREEERTRIARELHDELGQMLTAIRFNLAQIATQASFADEAAGRRLYDLETIAADAMAAVRQISQKLHPRILDALGLEGAIKWECEEFVKRMGIRCVCEIESSESGLPDLLKIHVFRLFQEAMTNIAKHAEATCVGVELGVDEATVTLSVRDNGLGIRMERMPPTSLGLTSMKERAAQIGGALLIESIPAYPGTRICLTAPF